MATSIERVAAQAIEMAKANTVLRKIAAHVPARVWIEAKEKAGFGTEIRATQLDDPRVDEAWLQFVAAGPDSITTKREAELEQALRQLLTDVTAFDKSGALSRLKSVAVAEELLKQ